MAHDPPNLLARTQASYNRSTRDHWDHFAQHRRRVTEMLVPADDPLGAAAAAGRLCVLGAGNCNDLELPRLLEAFDRVTLVDIDRDAPAAAVDRQGVAGHPRLDVRTGVDLTAVAGTLAEWPKRPPTDRGIDDCLRTLADAPMPELGGPFDVILSPCILSQICLFAEDTLGKGHPRRMDLRRAIRRRHVRQMVEWLRPGGTGLLVTDLVATRDLGSLVHSHRDRLDELLTRMVGQSRHFPGLDPPSIRTALLEDPLLAGLVASVAPISPWLWTLGPHKAFLVYAMRFRRALGTRILGAT
ncbi:MAG TPA: hypothetical protein VF796_25695 [Humisphaera sp.]